MAWVCTTNSSGENANVHLTVVINPGRHFCLHLFSFLERKSQYQAQHSAFVHIAWTMWRAGEKAVSCCLPVQGNIDRRCSLVRQASPAKHLAGARRDNPAAFFLLPALCSPCPPNPGAISSTRCWAGSAHETGRRLLLFFALFFLGLVFCQLSWLLNQVSAFPDTKDLSFWHS